MSEVNVKKVRFADDIPDSDEDNNADAIEIAAAADAPVNTENDIPTSTAPAAAELPRETTHVEVRRYFPMMWRYLTTRISNPHFYELLCVGFFVACLLFGVARYLIIKLEEAPKEIGEAANFTNSSDTL